MTRKHNTPCECLSADVINLRPAIDALRDQIVEAVERHGFDRASCFAIRLAVEEALSNAFKHGHRNLPIDTPVHVSCRIDPDRVEIAVEDRGPGFDPRSVPDPTREDHLEIPSGRGLFLIRSYMADVEFNDRGNRLRMLYKRPPGR